MGKRPSREYDFDIIANGTDPWEWNPETRPWVALTILVALAFLALLALIGGNS